MRSTLLILVIIIITIDHHHPRVLGSASFQLISWNKTQRIPVGGEVHLDCRFILDNFTLFDYPVVWHKKQLNEISQLNIMSNMLPPFDDHVTYSDQPELSSSSPSEREVRRFRVSYQSQTNQHNFGLHILRLTPRDAGTYYCEINAPRNKLLAMIEYQLHVLGDIENIHIVSDDCLQEPDSIHHHPEHRRQENGNHNHPPTMSVMALRGEHVTASSVTSSSSSSARLGKEVIGFSRLDAVGNYRRHRHQERRHRRRLPPPPPQSQHRYEQRRLRHAIHSPRSTGGVADHDVNANESPSSTPAARIASRRLPPPKQLGFGRDGSRQRQERLRPLQPPQFGGNNHTLMYGPSQRSQPVREFPGKPLKREVVNSGSSPQNHDSSSHSSVKPFRSPSIDRRDDPAFTGDKNDVTRRRRESPMPTSSAVVNEIVTVRSDRLAEVACLVRSFHPVHPRQVTINLDGLEISAPLVDATRDHFSDASSGENSSTPPPSLSSSSPSSSSSSTSSSASSSFDHGQFRGNAVWESPGGHLYLGTTHRTLVEEEGGQKGQRLIRHSVARFSQLFAVRADDHGKLLWCTVDLEGVGRAAELRHGYARLNVLYPPSITCFGARASVGERNVALRCVIVSNPPSTSQVWHLDPNGTSVKQSHLTSDYWTLIKDSGNGTVETLLYIRSVKAKDFKNYKLIATNVIASSDQNVVLSPVVTTSETTTARGDKGFGTVQLDLNGKDQLYRLHQLQSSSVANHNHDVPKQPIDSAFYKQQQQQQQQQLLQQHAYNVTTSIRNNHSNDNDDNINISNNNYGSRNLKHNNNNNHNFKRLYNYRNSVSRQPSKSSSLLTQSRSALLSLACIIGATARRSSFSLCC